MNEQQLADLFSDQLDHLLQGQTSVLPPEAHDLEELLDFGQQVSRITFQPSPAAQTAFQGQLTAWFGPAPGGLATLLGIPKTLLWVFIAAAIVVGTGVGLILLGLASADNSDGLSTPEAPLLPAAAPQGRPETLSPVDSEAQESPGSEAAEPGTQATPGVMPQLPRSSLGDTLPTGGPASLGETLSPPTPIATAPAEADSGEGAAGRDDSVVTGGPNDIDDDVTDTDRNHDRGHGNDPDGIDEDNPGNSGDVLENGGQSNRSRGGPGSGNGDDGGQGGQGKDGEKVNKGGKK